MPSSRWRGLKPSPSRCALVGSAMVLAIAGASGAAIGCAKPPSVQAAVPAPPAPPNPLQQLAIDIDALIDRPGHQHGIWGIAVYSLPENERLYERNSGTLLIPASAMKLVSVAAASEAVAWTYTFETRMLAAGTVVNGVLQGDLVITGNGDPTLLGRASDASLAPWIDAVRAHGITRIDGRVIADDDAVEEPRPGFVWSWE